MPPNILLTLSSTKMVIRSGKACEQRAGVNCSVEACAGPKGVPFVRIGNRICDAVFRGRALSLLFHILVSFTRIALSRGSCHFTRFNHTYIIQRTLILGVCMSSHLSFVLQNQHNTGALLQSSTGSISSSLSPDVNP